MPGAILYAGSRRMLRRAIGALIIALLAASLADAATLYVNNSGSPACSDATAKASNSAGSPWCTMGRAAWGNATRSTPSSGEAASAGDVVLVTAGTYDTTQGSENDNDTTYNPANSGTAGNLIEFRAVGTVTLTLSGGTWGAMIGASSRNYIKWNGFTIDEANARCQMDSGTVVVESSTGVVITNNVLTGNMTGSDGAGTSQDHNSNHSGVRLNAATATTISNNTITNYHTSPNYPTTGVNRENGNGIETYNSYGGFDFTHNTISNVGTGMFIKEMISGALDGTNLIRFNKITTTTHGAGITLHRFGSGTHTYQVTQNLIRAATDGAIKLKAFDGTEGPRNATIANNTIVGTLAGGSESGINVNGGLITADAGIKVYNNIFYNTSFGLYSGSQGIAAVGADADIDTEHNVYYSHTNMANLNGTSYTLATWKSGSGQDSVSPVGASSDPLFVDTASHNYKLQGESPYLAQGVDILDLDGDASTSDNIPAGAYITGSETIGVETASASMNVVFGLFNLRH